MQINPASYRDSQGYVFRQDGKVYRYFVPGYRVHYDQLLRSGLYDELVGECKMVPHREVNHIASFGFTEGYVLLPEQIPFISYPYEWSFDMWKDAALLTLQIAGSALAKNMILKDATAFNIQFHNGKPVFIDTLSFEKYEEGKPWIAYRQFCESFLAPLLLMRYCHPDTSRICLSYPNGIPMQVLATLLPKRAKWNLHTFMHVYLQAKMTGRQKKKSGGENKFSKLKLEILLKGLENYVKKIEPRKFKTTWDDYYTDTILGDEYLEAKTKLVNSFIAEITFHQVIDLGANDGHFSLLFGSEKNVIATDSDPNCINALYNKIKVSGIRNVLPLVNNLVVPSPAIGWVNAERESMTDRLKADLVLALALVHHLAIANNVPLRLIADWLQAMGENLIIEFVPKSDEKVMFLLQHRTDIFDDYNLENFKSVFAQYYHLLTEAEVGNTGRILFLMQRKV